jgi:tight adherence protein B
MNVAVVGLSVALAVAVLIAPRGRAAAEIDLMPAAGQAGAATESSDVRIVVTQVIALLKAGVAPGAAWGRVTGAAVDDMGVPAVADLAARIGDVPAQAVTAATRLAVTTGAPLAQVLHSVSDALAIQGEAQAEREAALAGPRTTARVLAWLPVAGAFLGWILGANPVATASDGGFGTLAVIAGLAFLAAGRVWTARLIVHARQAGDQP